MFRLKTLLLSLVLIAPCAAGGWGRLELNTEDVIILPGRPALFAAAFQRKYTLAVSDDITNARVEFYLDGKRVGQAITDKNGTAAVRCSIQIPAGRPSTYTVRAYRKGAVVEGTGRVFYWNPKRTAIAVDVDETISHTHYSDLFIADMDKHSRPLDGSAQALWELSRDYELFYISARPRYLNQKTRDWLNANGFPPGAVANALKFEACLHQRRYKQEMLVRFRQYLPNLLIGVGDKDVDDRAYGANRMLTIIVDKRKRNSYRDHCMVFANWQQITAFFDEQRTRLSDPHKLSTVIVDSNMNLRPVFAAPPIMGEPTGIQPPKLADTPDPAAGYAKARTVSDSATP